MGTSLFLGNREQVTKGTGNFRSRFVRTQDLHPRGFLNQKRTVIVITHRIAQALRADKIFVLESGSITASGRHTDLMEREGLYATLWQQSHPTSHSPKLPLS
jgi:ABC-type hemin transport system ATPase subunit